LKPILEKVSLTSENCVLTAVGFFVVNVDKIVTESKIYLSYKKYTKVCRIVDTCV